MDQSVGKVAMRDEEDGCTRYDAPGEGARDANTPTCSAAHLTRKYDPMALDLVPREVRKKEEGNPDGGRRRKVLGRGISIVEEGADSTEGGRDNPYLSCSVPKTVIGSHRVLALASSPGRASPSEAARAPNAPSGHHHRRPPPFGLHLRYGAPYKNDD